MRPCKQDYRWAVLRKIIPHPVAWQLFNFGFIALYQNILLLLIAAPSAVAWRHKAGWY